MLFLSLIYMAMGFKLIKSIYINRANTLIVFYSALLTFHSLHDISIPLYNHLSLITSLTIISQLFLCLLTLFTLFLGESGKLSEYSYIILISVFGMNFLLISNDLITMILAIELISYPLYIVSSLDIYKDLNKNTFSGIFAGLKYLLIGSLASCLIILGSALLYGEIGLTNISKITELLSCEMINTTEGGGGTLGIILIMVGLLLKIGAAPFHNWAPDVYDGVPTIVTSWISISPKIIFLIFLAIFMNHFLDASQFLSSLIFISSIFCLLIGSIMGLLVFRIKRLLAYSSISHLGFILLGIGLINYINIMPIIFYIMVYGLTSINIFLIISSLHELELLSQLKGNNKLLGISLVISLFSLAGIPPFIGFFGKMLILIESVNLGYNLLTIIGLITSVISAVYYMRVVKILKLEPYEEWVKIKLNETISSTIALISLLLIIFILNGDVILYITV